LLSTMVPVCARPVSPVTTPRAPSSRECYLSQSRLGDEMSRPAVERAIRMGATCSMPRVCGMSRPAHCTTVEHRSASRPSTDEQLDRWSSPSPGCDGRYGPEGLLRWVCTIAHQFSPTVVQIAHAMPSYV
jgi:hypothetical protein